MARDLRDKVIIITGASAGIGAATARHCARAGMKVVLAARRAQRLEALAAELTAQGGQALALPCDVDREAEVAALVARAVAHFGRLDVMYANAGFGICGPVLQASEAEVRAIFETNFFGTLRCLRAAAPAMRQTPGGLRHLVICSSAASELAPPNYGPYAATKAAQDAIASALRAELAAEGWSVTSVHPIGTATEFDDRTRQRMGGAIPQAGTPASLRQSADRVAAGIVKALRRPRAEVWPSVPARLALAAMTAFPALGAAAMRRSAAKSVGGGNKRNNP